MQVSEIALVMISFVFGTVFGSFFNVILYRFPKEDRTWVKGRSECESCGHQIFWYDNIPLLSYLFLGGQCRHCGQRIDLVHPAVEFFTGLIFAGVAWWQLIELGRPPLLFLFWLVVFNLSWLIFLFDLFYFLIPDELVLALLSLAIVLNFGQVVTGTVSFKQFLLSLAVSLASTGLFWFLRWITHNKGMGLGDVKLVAPLTLLMGIPEAVIGVLFAFILGAVFGIILILIGRKKLGHKIAFGPFLVLAFWASLIWGEFLWQLYWQLII